VKYLEAFDIVDNCKYKKKKNLNIISSFNSDPLNLFTKAIFAKKKINLKIYNNQFNTLKQTLIKIKPNKNLNLVLLCPWDFCEKLNWRFGIDSKINYFNEVNNDIKFLTELIISKKKFLKVVFFDLPIPETLINLGENKKLSINIRNACIKISNKVLKYNSLDLTKFIDIGFPFETKTMYKICKDIHNVLFLKKKDKKNYLKNDTLLNKNYDIGSKKILATDFDGVLWDGIVADDGYKNIKCANDVSGYKHYLFQSLIKKLLKRGIILIGVTRNKLSSAKKAFLNKSNTLVQNDFIKIYATYKNKSESIKQACHDLNLSLDSVVFVDDNLIEINEVKQSLPKISTVLFPKNEKNFSKFIKKINLSFQKNYITKEDKIRILSYKNITFKKILNFILNLI
jgi:HAD superfamily phosphatase (TIGR01681 family)